MTTVRFAFMAIVAVALLAMLPGLIRSSSAQEASPAASPEAAADCTADLGLVRSTKACVAIVHASADAPAVDVYLNGDLAVTALAPSSATPFVELPAGDYLVHVVPTGGTVEQAVITVDPLTIEAARAYEVVALGNVAEIGAAVFDVTTYAVPSTDSGRPQARLRVVNTVSGAPPIDVQIIATEEELPSRARRGVAYATASSYIELDSGTYWVSILEGTLPGADDLPAFELPGDVVVSVFAVANPDGSVGLLPVVTAASRLPAPDASPVATPTA